MPTAITSSGITFDDATTQTTSATKAGGIGPTQLASNAVTGPKLADGMVVQVVYSQTTAAQTLDELIPADNTKPQNTEGEQVLEASITPTSSTNKILVEAMIQGSAPTAAGGTLTLALFRNSTVDAISSAFSSHVAGFGNQVFLTYQDSPSTVSSVTYRVRAGYPGSGGGVYMNQNANGSNVYGGTTASWIKLTEIKAS